MSEPEIAAPSYTFIVEEQQAIGPPISPMPDEALQNIADIDAALTGEEAPTLDIGRYLRSELPRRMISGAAGPPDGVRRPTSPESGAQFS